MQLHQRIGRRLKLQDINILMTVVEAGSMRKAAALLNTTQPAISRSIADLEYSVGVRLLDRTSQGIEPTRYGDALLRRGLAVFDELTQGVKDIEFLADPSAGELRIGTGTALADGIVLPTIERISRQYPRVVFHVMSGLLNMLSDELRGRRIDLGFAWISTMDSEENIEAEFLFSEPLVVVAGAKTSWARRRKIDLAELAHELWTLPPPGSVIERLVSEGFLARGLTPPRASVYAQPTNMRLRMAESGRFVSVVTASAVQFARKNASIKVLPVDFPSTGRQVAMITLKNRTLSPLAQHFMACAKEVAKSIGGKPTVSAQHGPKIRAR
jgi:DNA-binding transcriptional LysR family regulator